MRAAVGRVVSTSWGEIYLQPHIGCCYEVNQAWVVNDGAGIGAAALVRDVDRLMGAAGLAHRHITLEDRAASRLGPALEGMGYTAAHHVHLAHEGPAPGTRGIAVHEVPIDAVVAGYDRYLRTDPDAAYGRGDLVRAHLLEHHRTFGAAGAARERCFAVVRDGEAVAWAKLWTAEGHAQVEDVICLAEHRGHGFGWAVVAAATSAALAEGARLVVIAADADDWPQELYRRLGYVPIGTKEVFTRVAWEARRRPAPPLRPRRTPRSTGPAGGTS